MDVAEAGDNGGWSLCIEGERCDRFGVQVIDKRCGRKRKKEGREGETVEWGGRGRRLGSSLLPSRQSLEEVTALITEMEISPEGKRERQAIWYFLEDEDNCNVVFFGVRYAMHGLIL